MVLGGQNPPRSTPGGPGSPGGSQVGPRRVPGEPRGRPKTLPGHPWSAPRSPRGAPRVAQRHPESPKSTPQRGKWSQKCSQDRFSSRIWCRTTFEGDFRSIFHRFSIKIVSDNDWRIDRELRREVASKLTSINMANTHPTRQKPMSQLCSPKSKLDRAMRKVDETNIENTIEKRPARSMSTQPFRQPFRYQKTMKNVTFCTQMGSFWTQIGRPGSFLPPSWPSRVDLGSIGPTRIDPGRSHDRSWVDRAPRWGLSRRAPTKDYRIPGSNSL